VKHFNWISVVSLFFSLTHRENPVSGLSVDCNTKLFKKN
jgi:hypothetical protein